jgi:hypothetical protein
MTALEALRVGLKEVQSRQPGARVYSVMSGQHDPDGTVTQWILEVYNPAQQVTYQYSVRAGQVSQTGSGGMIVPPDRPLLADPGNGFVADVLDSDTALAAAESLGGARYREQTGASVQEMLLGGFVGQPLQWAIFYSKPNTDHQATLNLDASTGNLVSVDTQDTFASP